MTQSKREPFARATKHPTLDTWIVADVAGNNLCWSDGSQSWEKWDAEARANAVNAAFNALVDEEVKKAVEDNEGFKAKLIESMNCPEDADPVWAHGFKVAQVAIAKIVRAKNLPREFPGAGEIK